MKKNYLILIFFLFSVFIWSEIYLPKRFQLEEEKLFSVGKGQNLLQISENLEKEGLIKNKYFFDFFVLIRGKAKKLQAGEYELSPSMNIPEIAKKIISGEVIKTKITIIEGWTFLEIGEYLETRGIISRAKHFYGLNSPMAQKDFSEEFDFLKDKPKDLLLEGYLFPDTYYLNAGVSIEEIIRTMLNNFDKKITPELREEIQQQGKTIFEIVTMASLIEKEVREKEEKEIVSGILWKRLENKIPLQVDATITYITGKKTTKISKEETQIDSPYNTYKYLGLPPGPICNPGIDSIEAAIYPKSSEYWYYLSTPEGETIFSKTLEEHNLAKARYLK